MILAEKIALLRKKRGWSQEELAAQLGISRQSVSKWESAASIPELDKILKLGELFGVSTDYLLKDEMETETFPEEEFETAETGRILSLEEAKLFLEDSRSFAQKISVAVMMFIFSPIILILLTALAEGEILPLTSDMADGIGLTVLLVIVAIGVGICILSGLSYERYSYLEKEMISLDYGVSGIVEKEEAEFEPIFRGNLACGIVVIIVGVVPLVIMDAFHVPTYMESVGAGILIFLVGISVNRFVWAGIIHESFKKLLQKEEYTKEEKEFHNNKVVSGLTGAYWCIVTAIYLGISFLGDNWEVSWIVWPVAGVLFGAFSMIMKAVFRLEK